MSKENYTNHNLVSNYSYEIYREDGSLREKYEPEAKADCEGTFEVNIKDKDGNLKSHEEKPIRSLQKYFLRYVLYSNGYRFLNYNYGSRCHFINDKAPCGGIYFGVVSGTSPNYTFTRPSMGQWDDYDNNITYGVSYLTYNSENNSIDVSVRRENRMGVSGNASFVGIGTDNDNDFSKPFCADIVNISWSQYSLVSAQYNFSFPTSSTSSLTKNFLADLFVNIFTNNKTIKDINGNDFSLTVAGSYGTNSVSNFLGTKYFAQNVVANQIDAGIVLGNSDNSVVWDDYHLHSIFNTNELKPEAVRYEINKDYIYEPQQSGNKFYTWYARNFVNVSDSDITVKEVGVYSKNTSLGKSVMLARWLTGDVVVHSGESIRVYWRPTVIVE